MPFSHIPWGFHVVISDLARKKGGAHLGAAFMREKRESAYSMVAPEACTMLFHFT
jgi:hypothetical protein